VESKLVDDIMGKINQADADITSKRNEWLEYYKLYRSYRDDVRSTGRSAISVPAAFEWVEVVKSRLFDVFFGKRPYVRTIGREPGDDRHAKGIQIHQNYQYEQARYRKLGYDIIGSTLIFGTGISKNYWKFIEKNRVVQVPADPTMPELGYLPIEQLVPVYDNVCFEYIDPFDFNVDPEATTIDDATWCSQKVRRTEEYIRDMAKRGIYKNVNEMILEMREGGSTETNQNKQTMLQIDGHYPDKQGLMRPIEIIEYWEDDRIVTIGNGKFTLRDSKNPYYHGRKPFTVAKIISVPQEFWGISLIEAGAQAAKLMEDLLNNGMDNLNFAVNSMIGVNENLVEDTEMVSTPGKIVHTRGNPRDILFPLQMPDVTANVFNFYNLANDIAKRSTGVVDYVVGQASGGRTATEASLLTNEAAKRIGLHIHIFGDTFVGPLAEMTHELNRQFVTAEKTIRVTGMEGDPYEEVRITPDVFGANVDFIWEHEDRELNSMVARQELLQSLTIAQGNPSLWGIVPIIFYKFLKTYDMHENDELVKAVELAKTTAMIMMAQASASMTMAGSGLPNVQKLAGGSESNINQSIQKKGNPQAGATIPTN